MESLKHYFKHLSNIKVFYIWFLLAGYSQLTVYFKNVTEIFDSIPVELWVTGCPKQKRGNQGGIGGSEVAFLSPSDWTLLACLDTLWGTTWWPSSLDPSGEVVNWQWRNTTHTARKIIIMQSNCSREEHLNWTPIVFVLLRYQQRAMMQQGQCILPVSYDFEYSQCVKLMFLQNWNANSFAWVNLKPFTWKT